MPAGASAGPRSTSLRPLASLHNIHYAKCRNTAFGVGVALDQVLPPFPGTQQGRDRSMTTMDPHDRIDMTGPWAGFGFQGSFAGGGGILR